MSDVNQSPLPPQTPNQAPAPVNPLPPTTQKSTSAAGIVALILGVIAVVFSFIPIINNFAIVLAAIGLVLAIVAIVSTKKNGKKKGRGIAIAGLVLTVVALVISFAMQAAASSAIDEATKSLSSSTSQSAESDDTKASEKTSDAQKNEGDLANAHASIESVAKSNNDYEGKPTILLTIKWKNTSDTNQSAMTALNPKVYQNKKTLDTAVYTNNPKGYDPLDESNEIKAGAETTTILAYTLDDASADVEVELSNMIGNSATIVRTFKL